MTDPIKTALETARAHIKWLAFGECRADNWQGPPPTALQAVEAVDAALEGLEKAEPVLWLSEGGEVTGSKRKAEYWVSHGGTATPLFTHPAPVQAEPAAQSNQLSGNSGELNLIARAEQAEPVAWLVYAGILDMRPVYPAYNTKELAESAAACIKSNTEVRPLYLAPPAAPAKLEPLTLAEVDAVREKLRGTEYDIYGYTRAIEAAHNAKLGGK